MANKKPYVLVSVFKEDANEQEVAGAAGKIATIIDDLSLIHISEPTRPY